MKVKVDPNKLVYKFKDKGKTPKDSRDYLMLLELFENFTDGVVLPTEVLENQINFKSNLSQTRIGGNESENKKTW